MNIEQPIVLTEFPKSGGSWIVSMLGDILDLHKRDIYVTSDFRLFDITKHPWYEDSTGFDFPVKSVIKSHELPGSPLIDFDATYVHVIRDGRDVVVSKWFFEKEFCVKNGIIDSFDKDFESYVAETAADWSAYIKSWSGETCLAVHYEDFLIDPVNTLKGLLKTITDYDFPLSQIEETVLKFSKARFSSSFSRAFKHNSFVRKGISGDWKNHFSEQDVETFKNIAGDTLISLGYESSLDWQR